MLKKKRKKKAQIFLKIFLTYQLDLRCMLDTILTTPMIFSTGLSKTIGTHHSLLFCEKNAVFYRKPCLTYREVMHIQFSSNSMQLAHDYRVTGKASLVSLTNEIKKQPKNRSDVVPSTRLQQAAAVALQVPAAIPWAVPPELGAVAGRSSLTALSWVPLMG